MVEQSRRRASYQDVLNAPADKIAEVINGELRLSPQPRLGHQSVSSNLGVELGPPFGRGRGGPGGWILVHEPELHLGEDILVPDISGWRRERLPALDGDAPYLTLAPDWLCEVLSPSTETMDRADKLPIYAAEKVGHIWLINPRQRTLEVLRLYEGNWLTLAVHRDDQRVRAEPFDAVELDLAMLWADLSNPPLRASEPAAAYGDYERVL